jgi:hypothetical protein
MDEEESAIGITSQQQQMVMVQQQDQYLSQRGQAIESIESTIHELGSIFQQLAQMVQEQSETVQRSPILPGTPFSASFDSWTLTDFAQDRCHYGRYRDKCIWCPAGIVEILCESNQQSLVDDQNIWRLNNILSSLGACELGYRLQLLGVQ